MSIFIQKAWYGAADELAIDVTTAVLNLFGNPQKTAIFTIAPATFGLSGLPAKTRYFSMSYTYSSAPDATVITKSGADGAQWKIHASNPNATLTILKATYGTNEIFKDITNSMSLALLESDQNAQFTVGTPPFIQLFCGAVDIAYGVQKILTVTYSDSSTSKTQTWVAADWTAVNLYFPPGS